MAHKKIIIIFFMLIGIVESQAQVTLRPGVRAGVNFSKFTSSDTDFKTGFYIGGQLAIKFVKLYTLQPELVYSRQGANGTFSFSDSDIQIDSPDQIYFFNKESINYTIDYLSLSIINKFYIGSGFHFLAGPSLDFKVNDNFQNYYSGGNLIGFDFSLIGGLGYSLSNGLSFEARFKQGLIDIYGFDYNSSYDDEYNDQILLNQSFQLGATYTFDLK